jgi:hypothetical protein
MFITSAIFLLAIIMGGYAITASIAGNIERICEVIDQRDGQVTANRKITVGVLRSPATKPVMQASARLRRPVMAKRNNVAAKIPQREWSIAA